jgi:hypothetical protein
LYARGIRDAVLGLMLSLCLALALAQVAPEADAPVQPTLTPAEEGVPVAAIPTQPPQDPKKTTRILLTGGAGIAGAGAALGAMVLFSNIRSNVNGTGASFDMVFGTAALGSLLVAGVGFAVHQAFGGRGEAALAALASVACMALTGLAVGAAQLDQQTGAIMVAAVGAIPAAVSVTAILEATGALGGNARGRAW